MRVVFDFCLESELFWMDFKWVFEWFMRLRRVLRELWGFIEILVKAERKPSKNAIKEFKCNFAINLSTKSPNF
jgi:hypothetical protein